jgi:FtsH-binding integral membrane protein
MADFEKVDTWKQWEVEERLGFIRKVYGILATQLTLTAVTCAFPMFNMEAAQFFNKPALLITCMISTIVIVCGLVCVKKLARAVPINYILMTIFTLSEAILVGAICSRYDPLSVFTAASMTGILVCGLTVYAMTTKTDFSFMYSFGISLLLCLISMVMFIIAFTFQMRILYCTFGVMLFSLYLIIDTQMIVSNYGLSTDDYILGAIIIYMDIIQIFLYILQIFGNKN